MEPKIICISGKAGAGKDTIATCLAAELLRDNHTAKVTHYADLLKYICKEYYGWNGEKDERGRSLLQRVGTNSFRESNPNFWVDFLVEVVLNIGDQWEYVIIPDARFPNEISRWKDFGFDVLHIHVDRPICSALTGEQQRHPSETALNDVVPNIVFKNNCGLNTEEFNKKIRVLVDKIELFFGGIEI